jgi:serine/threonine protein kinase/formylglycine-generating enzyme required for sulfatase activity
MSAAQKIDAVALVSRVAGFLDSHPAASPAQFAAWAAGQRELARHPAWIRDLAAWSSEPQRLLSELSTRLGIEPEGSSAADASVFRPGQRRPPPTDSVRGAGGQLAPGARVAHFELRRLLGRGGMGEVWEAFDESLRRAVALKFVLPEQVDLRALERFEREARAGGRMAHANLVRTLAFGREGELAWIAQELVEGAWTLKDFLDDLRSEESLPKGYYRQVAGLVAALAEGLQVAHDAGVIHRDLKPQNILIAPDDTPKVADFGLARVSDDPFQSMTGEGGGTYFYMSPEQVAARRLELDHRTDIFSLGVVLYELLALRRPFEGDTIQQISERIQFWDPPEPARIRSMCPADLSVICGKALAKQPERRYASMAELAADLRRHLANRPILARPPSPWVKLGLWVRRNPTPSAALAVGGVALALISGLLVQQVRTGKDLERSNVDLASQTRRAETGEREARQNAEQAERNATAAQLARDEATQKANDVLALSAQKDHDDLVAEAATLWPAHPEMIPAYEDWLRRANELIEGRPADEAKGLKKRQSLAEHKAKLADLRRDAKALSAAEIQADRESHPKYTELSAKQTELLWLSRMLGAELWPSEAEVEAELAQESLPRDADALNSLVWPLVDQAKPVFGQEVRAVLLARRAVIAADEDKRAGIRDTLAWALFKLGRFDEALVEVHTALSERGGNRLKSSAADLERAVAAWRGDELARQRQERDALAAQVAKLTSEVSERRTYEFDDPEQEWWNRQLMKLVNDLEQLRDPKTGLMNDVLSEPFGWGVGKRYAFARAIGERSVDGPEAKRLWSEAIAAIRASPKYGELEIVPQMGLLPIGMDPDSQLWEFAHLQTGEPAMRGADGKLVLTEETGLVFVLIPGGTFWMGAQNKPGAQNHDPAAQSDERPVHEVELSPYFLSKYEMTQGQWQQIAASNPSGYQPPEGLAPSLLHPVEQVSWMMCFELLESLGLSLPSEAQWECGARGGTSTAWWTGQDRESLRGKINIADQTAKKSGAPWPGIANWPDLEDGSAVHCAVGNPIYPGNGFGLHEVAGNMWEWCLDGYDPGIYGKHVGKDPMSPWSGASKCVSRGGSFDDVASLTRSAYRHFYPPEARSASLGLRPARAVRR